VEPVATDAMRSPVDALTITTRQFPWSTTKSKRPSDDRARDEVKLFQYRAPAVDPLIAKRRIILNVVADRTSTSPESPVAS